MSRATIDRFFDHLESDCQLQLELASLTTSDGSGSLSISEDAFLELASSNGYQVTSAELQGFLLRRAPSESAELAEDDLDAVVGGVGMPAAGQGAAQLDHRLWQAVQRAL